MDPGVILLLVSLQECTIDWLAGCQHRHWNSGIYYTESPRGGTGPGAESAIYDYDCIVVVLLLYRLRQKIPVYFTYIHDTNTW